MAERFRIRLAQIDDAPRMLEIYAPYVRETVSTFEIEVPGLREFEERIHRSMNKLPWLVATCNDQIAGYCYVSDHRCRNAYQCTKELSVYIAGNFQRRKIGFALYRAALEIMQLMGVMTVLAGIVRPNPGSVKFHEKNGFRIVGTYHRVGFKLGEYRDVSWFEIHLQDPNSKFKPVSLEEIGASGRLDVILEKASQFIDRERQ